MRDERGPSLLELYQTLLGDHGDHVERGTMGFTQRTPGIPHTCLGKASSKADSAGGL